MPMRGNIKARRRRKLRGGAARSAASLIAPQGGEFNKWAAAGR
jgi:hypothetical protein